MIDTELNDSDSESVSSVEVPYTEKFKDSLPSKTLPSNPAPIVPQPGPSFVQSQDFEEIIEESVSSESAPSEDSEIEDDSDNDITIPTDPGPLLINENPLLLKFVHSRDSLLRQKDNIVIFIFVNGDPYDNGSRELDKQNLLPPDKTLTYERASVSPFKSYTLISLPIKFDNQTFISARNIKNCIDSLRDIVTQLQLTSFSIRKTNLFDEIPWTYLMRQLTNYFEDITVTITICHDLVRAPEPQERIPLISEYHSSAFGGHKGMTKTYNRIRPYFYWKNMKRDINDFISKCRICQLKKLT